MNSIFVFAVAVLSTIVWADSKSEAPTKQSGPMKHTGRLLYTGFKVFGGSCVWLGDRWVLTSRHGVKDWSTAYLKVDFPAHGKASYAIEKIHLPKDEKIDLALLELKQPLDFGDPLTLDARVLKSAAKVRFGGYGYYGTAKKPTGNNRFHWGSNVLDSANEYVAKFSLGKPSEAQPNEAIPAMFDSGSPVFLVEKFNGREMLFLVGITVRVSNGTAPGIGDRAVSTCVAGQARWIKKTAAGLKWK